MSPYSFHALGTDGLDNRAFFPTPCLHFRINWDLMCIDLFNA
ncbi:hypothetical protein [Candidatus Protochlamydia naegleriophila]|nr:hypothetical protein [Candidatus Protochlamydia naegleriophila]